MASALMPVRSADVQALEAQHVLQTYARAGVVFVRGEGCRLFDADGRSYLDFLSGIGVAVLGHGDPELAAVVADQARTLIHTSNLYFHPLQGVLAARLAELSGLERVFFCNSGTEAVEACLKFARRHWYSQGQQDRTRFVALEGAFSGRSMGSLSVTSNPKYREPFGPLLEGVTFVSPDHPEALSAAAGDHTAAIIAEPIQGEGGIRPLPAGCVAAIEDCCASTGTLLIADEVQCGLGRTGHPFVFPRMGLTPDLVSIGKALGSGVPIGAALVSARVATQIQRGDHGTTYGGNLLATRAALHVLDRIMGASSASAASGHTDGLLPQVRETGEYFGSALTRLQQRHPLIREVRGVGLMRGLLLDRDATASVDAALRAGLLVNRTAERVIRMLPPLTVTAAEIDEAVALLDRVLTDPPGDART